MRCLSQIRAAVFLAFLSGVAFGQAKPEEPIKPAHISGRLVTLDGNPVSFPVRISKLDWDVPPNELTAMADGHGVFTFLAESNRKYKIWLGAGMKTAPRMVDTANGKDIDVGDLVFEYCPPVNASAPMRPVSQPQLIGGVDDPSKGIHCYSASIIRNDRNRRKGGMEIHLPLA